MKLSEAIRLGAQRVPQSYGRYFAFNSGWSFFDERELTGACALGSAMLAMEPDVWRSCNRLTEFCSEKLFPDVKLEIEGEGLNLMAHVIRANDAGASREDIADFLEWLDF